MNRCINGAKVKKGLLEGEYRYCEGYRRKRLIVLILLTATKNIVNGALLFSMTRLISVNFVELLLNEFEHVSQKTCSSFCLSFK